MVSEREAIEAPGPRRLSDRARAGLDLARAIAATYVVFHHLAARLQLPAPIDLLFSFGQEAVLVFFLLSGFVIYANERDRSEHPRGYFLRRLRRIYPPIILAMIVSSVLWAVGLIQGTPTWQSAVSTLLSLQDISFLKPGVVSDPYLGNDPLWSLSYEVFFYLVFPLVMVGWRRNILATRVLVGVVSVVGLVTYLLLPNHLSLVVAYFLIWWAGAMAAHAYLNGRMRMGAVLPELVGLAALIVVAAIGVIEYGYHGLGFFPVLIIRHVAFAAVLFALLFTTVRRRLAAVSAMVARPAAVVAGVSYGLYVVHFPVLVQTGATQSLPWFLLALVVTVALAWIADVGLPKILPKAPKT